MRALPVALRLLDQARVRKRDTDLGNRLTAQAFGLLGRPAVPTIIGLHNAGKLPDCGTVPGAGVMAWPAVGHGVLAAGGLRGEEDEQA